MAPERDLAQVVVVADAAEHEVLVLGGVCRRRRGLAAVLLGPGLGLGAVAIVDGEVVPPFLRICPAIGKPITPKPIHATFAMSRLLVQAQTLACEGDY